MKYSKPGADDGLVRTALKLQVADMTSRPDIFRQRVVAFDEPLAKAKGGKVRAVHRARVASRRLREILPVMEADASECRRALDRLRQAARQLGRLRDLDVSLQLLDDVEEAARGPSPGVRTLRKRLAQTRQDALDKARRRGWGRKLHRTAKLLTRLAESLSDGAPSTSRRWRWTLGARGAHRAQALLAAMDDAGQKLEPEAIHNVRKALKRLRYAIELAEEAAGTGVTADLFWLTSAQSRLGRLHDRHVLMALVAEVRQSLRSRDRQARRDLRALSANLDAECRVLHAAYLGSRAALRDLCRRVLSQTEGVGAAGARAGVPERLGEVRLA